MMVPKVISFYTENTPYQQEVQSLELSCKQFGIEFEIEAMPPMLQSHYILEKRLSQQGALLWIDPNAVFLKKPDFSLFKGVDFALRFLTLFRDKPENMIHTGTIYIADTVEATQLCKAWENRVRQLLQGGEAPSFLDQIALYDVLQENQKAKVLPLPISYCKLDEIVQDDVVIEQRQISGIHR